MMEIRPNNIYNMDCREGLKHIDDGMVDCVITDPPYDVDYKDKSTHLAKFDKARQKQIDRDATFQNLNIDYALFAKEMYRVMKDKSHIYIFCGDKQVIEWYPMMLDAGFKFNNYLIWIKNKQTLDMTFGLKYNYKTELCLFFRKGVRKLRKIGHNNCLFYDTGISLKHPCQKPEAMIRFLMKQSTVKGELVLDPFMGSGTTAVVCKQIGRRYLGFETSAEYIKIIDDRLGQDGLMRFDLKGY